MAAFPPGQKVVEPRADGALVACDAAVVRTGSARQRPLRRAPRVAIHDAGWTTPRESLLLGSWWRILGIAMPPIVLPRTATLIEQRLAAAP
jgi:hypothetical protein